MTNFRSYDQLTFTPSSKVTIISGPNACGKTNLLESLQLLAFSRSLRSASDTNLIKWGSDFCLVSADFNKAADSTLEISATLQIKNGRLIKTFRHNKIAQKALANIGALSLVYFSPENISLISGPPPARRRYLDAALSLVDKNYRYHLVKYFAALRQRNALLKNNHGINSEDIHHWDHKLAEPAVEIIKKRRQFIDWLNQELLANYRFFEPSTQSLNIQYLSSLPLLNGDLSTDQFRLFLQNSLNQDLKLRTTTIGPQRDDFSLSLNGRPLSLFGSRGEWRGVLLSLKALESEFIYRQKGTRPILLLDDVFSELDETRRAAIFQLIEKHQTLITTANQDSMKNLVKKGAEIFAIKKEYLTSPVVRQ